MPSVDLDFATLDPHDESESGTARLKGWSQAVARGFLGGRMVDEPYDLWLRSAREDRARMSGAWVPATEYGASSIPVATFVSYAGDLNTGRAMLPLHMITDVTVSPAHRRQGLLRRLMTQDLQHAVDEGRPVAALTVSEGSIYGRFGFAPATWDAEIELDVSSSLPMPGLERTGRFEVVEPMDLWPVPQQIFEEWHRGSRGSVSRPAHYVAIGRGEWDWDRSAPDHRLRGIVHLDDQGRPDGYVLYRHQGWTRPRTLEVKDLVGRTPQVELALWQFVAEMDLTDVVKASSSLEDPLSWALADPRRRRVTGVKDVIWLRVLDVPRALEARPWYADGVLVLEVDDPLGHAAGRWRVETRDGVATVEPAAGSPDGTAELRLDVSTLSGLYLGGVSTATLAAAGRIRGAAVELWARMTDGGPAPCSRTYF